MPSTELTTRAAAAAQALNSYWVDGVDLDKPFDAEVAEALVQTVLDILVESGDLSAELAGGAWYEDASCEHDCCDFFHDAGITRVNLDGSIEQFPN